MTQRFLKYVLFLLLLIGGSELYAHTFPENDPLTSFDFFPEEEKAIQNDPENLTLLRNRLFEYRAAGKNDSLIITYLECEKHDFSNIPDIGVSVFLVTSDFFASRQAYPQAIKCRIEELKYHRLCKDNKLELDYFFCLGGLAGLYQTTGKLDKSLAYYIQAQQFAAQRKSPFLLLHAYNNLGVYYLRSKQFQKAITYFNKALQVKNLPNGREVRLMTGIINGNMASSLNALGLCKESLAPFEKNLATSKIEKEWWDYVQTAVLYSQSLKCAGRKADALNILLETEKLLIQPNLSSQEANVYKEIFATYLDNGQLALSKLYWEKYNHSYGQQLRKNQEEYSSAMESLSQQRVAFLQAEKRNKDLEVSLANSRMYRIIFLGILILLGAVIVVLIYQKRSRELAKTAALEKIQKDLLAVELQNRELRQKQTDFELQASKKDVTTLAIDLNQHEEIRKSLVKSLKEVQKVAIHSEAGDMVNQIIADINKQLHNGQSRALFNENISKVNNAFFENLSQRYPTLSKSELEFCGLLRLKLSSKEISTLKNISPDSAKVIRHRIRKKLGIGPYADIYKVMEEI